MVAVRGLEASTLGNSLKSEVKVISVCEFRGEVSWRRRSFKSGDRVRFSDAADGWVLGAGAARGGQLLVSEADGADLLSVAPVKPVGVVASSVASQAGTAVDALVDGRRSGWGRRRIRVGRRKMVAALCRAIGLFGLAQIWVGAKAFGLGSWLKPDGLDGFGLRFAVTGPVKGIGMQLTLVFLPEQ